MTTQPEHEVIKKIEELNEGIKQLGLPGFALVRPEDCLPQDVNARYMDQQMLQRLVSNLRSDGHLESVPLVCKSMKIDGKYDIISGHHRIEGAVKANINWIIVMVIEVKDMDELRAKQLSHNSIEGEDDELTLSKMYEELKSLQAKIYSGLQDKLQPVSVSSVSFRAGKFEAFTVAFMPEDVESYDDAVELVKTLPVTSKSIVRVANLSDFELFGKAIRDIKKVENIKSNAAALSRLLEIGAERVREMKAEKKAAKEEEQEAKDSAAEVKQQSGGKKKAGRTKKAKTNQETVGADG